MPRTTIHDLTTEFLSPQIDWKLPQRERELQFAESTRAIRDGLYVAVYVNGSDHDVWDNNTKPKVVIPANSSMLKYGKFQGGVLRRYRETFEHLRRRPPNGQTETWIHRELARLVLVLDLTPVALRTCSCADVFEPFWNGSIETWLSGRTLLVAQQRKRVESRRLSGGAPTKDDLLPLVSALQVRIEAAAKELAKDPPADATPPLGATS